MQSVSNKLQRIARRAFYDYVLPMIKKKFPQIEERFLVNITSSVAYGVADQYSDLDLFIIFEYHRDYEQFSKPLEAAINRIEFPKEFYTICDKGVRFELESLRRSDISKIFYNPDSDKVWMHQTDWLMYWFLNAVTIYDPSKLSERFRNGRLFYPDHILESKIYFTILSMWSDYFSLRRKKSVFNYYSLKKVFRILSRALDIYYWFNKSYTPHPKWKYRLAVLTKKKYNYSVVLNYLDEVLNAVVNQDVTKALNDIEELINYWEKVANLAFTDRCSFVSKHKLMNINLGNQDKYLVQNSLIDHKCFKKLKSCIYSGKNLLYPFELGHFHFNRRGYNYDIAMRISDHYRYLMRKKRDQSNYKIYENPNIKRKRFRYYNFVIWRKIRVVEKALKRNDLFLYIWYCIQVIDCLFEVIFRLLGEFIPLNEDYAQVIKQKSSKYLQIDKKLLEIAEGKELTDVLIKTENFASFCWKIYHYLQSIFLKEGFVNEREVQCPLDTQFEVEYWKYENLFL